MLTLVAILLFQTADLKEIEAQLQKLRSDSIEERSSGAERLRRLGPQAIPALEKAAADPDSEVAGRIRQILDGIEEDQARAVYREVETLLEKARSLRIEVRIVVQIHLGVDHDPTLFEGSGTILLKGACVLADLSLKTQEPPQRTILHTDGSALMTKGNDGPWKTRDLPATWKDGGFRVGIARVGAFSCWQSDGEGEDSGPRKSFGLSSFRRLPPDKTGIRLQYALRGEKSEDPGYDVTLWLHPKTRVPLRREFIPRPGPDSGEKKSIKVIEDYPTFEIDPELPDEVLRRPEK